MLGKQFWKGQPERPEFLSSITHSPSHRADHGIWSLWSKAKFEVAWIVSICLLPLIYISLAIVALAGMNLTSVHFFLMVLVKIQLSFPESQCYYTVSSIAEFSHTCDCQSHCVMNAPEARKTCFMAPVSMVFLV